MAAVLTGIAVATAVVVHLVVGVVIAVAAAAYVVVMVAPRDPEPDLAGVIVDRSDQAELWAEVEAAATEVAAPIPDTLAIVDSVQARIVHRTSGRGRRVKERRLELGLPGLSMFTREELRVVLLAVLARETDLGIPHGPELSPRPPWPNGLSPSPTRESSTGCDVATPGRSSTPLSPSGPPRCWPRTAGAPAWSGEPSSKAPSARPTSVRRRCNSSCGSTCCRCSAPASVRSTCTTGCAPSAPTSRGMRCSRSYMSTPRRRRPGGTRASRRSVCGWGGCPRRPVGIDPRTTVTPRLSSRAGWRWRSSSVVRSPRSSCPTPI